MITATVDASEVTQFFGKMSIVLPMELEGLADDIAKDVQKGARFRESSRRITGVTPAKGNLSAGIQTFKVKGKNSVKTGIVSLTPYWRVQEQGATGYRFIPKKGAGIYGEGYAVPTMGGSIPMSGGKHFIKDAISSTEKRLSVLEENFIRKVLR
jgi:hypothetical protein